MARKKRASKKRKRKETGEEIVPVVPGAGNANSAPGSPEQTSPWKNFCFRLSNYTQEDIEKLCSSNSSNVPQLGFQEEDVDKDGKETTPHLQGFGVFNTKRRPVAFWEPVMGHNRTHFEVMKGRVVHNVEYCTSEFYQYPGTKELVRKRKIGGFVYKRNCPRPLVKMTRAHLTEQQKGIVDKYKEFEDPLFGRQIHWYWEPQGEWGKTKTQKYMCHNMDATLVGGKKADMFYALAQLKLMTGEVPPIVIINLVKDTDMKYVSYAGMESIKDGLFFSKKFKSGMCMFNSPHLLVFANEPPDLSRFTEGTSKHRCDVFPLTAAAEESTDWAVD